LGENVIQAQTTADLGAQETSDISIISAAEISAGQEIDNMSVSEIIAQRFKR
jgi:hypothetical protein